MTKTSPTAGSGVAGGPTTRVLRCLIIEDSQSDALFLVHALKRAHYEPIFERVQTGDEFRSALQKQEWDIVFSDYVMPKFDALSALQIFREQALEMPFIIISGEIGEDRAVELLKLGADDYLLKHNLNRLIPLVERALKDWDERKRARRAERALQQSEDRFRMMVEQVLDYAIFMLDPEGRITTWNAGAKNIHGYSSGGVIGQSFSCFFTPEDVAAGKPAALLEQARNEGRVVNEGWCVHKDDTNFWAQVTLTATKDERGQLRGFTQITHDLTERRQAEDERRLIEMQLRQAQKLEAIGQLAAGMAHEINTPIQYAEHNLRFLQESFEDLKQLLDYHQILLISAENDSIAPEVIKEVRRLTDKVEDGHLIGEIPTAIQEALQGTERIAKIVRAMKEFSHPGANKEKPTPTNINHAIESTITVARNEWKYVADVVTEFDPAVPPVPLFVSEFNQVILNLLINAAHAIGDLLGKNSRTKGTITVSTRRDAGWVEVRVGDTGTGIPEAVRHRIFEPFFTTKPVGKGTGQGLALSRSVIVDRHHGELRFECGPGGGTCFIIRVPLNPPANHKNLPTPK